MSVSLLRTREWRAPVGRGGPVVSAGRTGGFPRAPFRGAGGAAARHGVEPGFRGPGDRPDGKPHRPRRRRAGETRVRPGSGRAVSLATPPPAAHRQRPGPGGPDDGLRFPTAVPTHGPLPSCVPARGDRVPDRRRSGVAGTPGGVHRQPRPHPANFQRARWNSSGSCGPTSSARTPPSGGSTSCASGWRRRRRRACPTVGAHARWLARGLTGREVEVFALDRRRQARRRDRHYPGHQRAHGQPARGPRLCQAGRGNAHRGGGGVPAAGGLIRSTLFRGSVLRL